MKSKELGFFLLMSTAVTGCTTFKPPLIGYDDEQPAVLQGKPPKPVQVVEIPKPLPLPGQLKPAPGGRSTPEPRDPLQRVNMANAAARVQPSRSGYVNAVQVFPFADGALYPRGIAQGEMPPLFIIGPEGKTSELVNYRVRGNHMIVDRLFAAAELRLGDKGSERHVRIVCTDGRLAW